MPTIEIRLVNVFLKPQEFAVLSVEVVPLWDDLDKADREENDARRPLPTALLRIPLTGQFNTPDEANRAAYWLVTLLGFLTRRPCGADLQVTISDDGNQVACRPLMGVAPQKRGGQAMFRTPEELRQVFDAAWHLWPEESEDNRRLHRALDWHNMARGGVGDKPLDLSLMEHWIAIESLATAWAKTSSTIALLSTKQIGEVREKLNQMAIAWALPEERVAEMNERARELARRPAKAA